MFKKTLVFGCLLFGTLLINVAEINHPIKGFESGFNNETRSEGEGELVSSTKLALGKNFSSYIFKQDDNQYLYSWGNNDYGQFGDGTTEGSLVPKIIDPDAGPTGIEGTITQLEAGAYHSLLAINYNGANRVYTYGRNNFGQLGTGDKKNSTIPVEINVDGGGDGIQGTVKFLSSSDYTSFAIIEDESGVEKLYGWGYNVNQQLGSASFGDEVLSPVEINIDGGAAGIDGEVTKFQSRGGHSGLVVKKENVEHLYMWGRNAYGQLGTGDNSSSESVEIDPDNGGDGIQGTITNLALGEYHTLISIREEDETDHAYSWGLNNFGQLGNDSTTPLFDLSVNDFRPTEFDVDADGKAGVNGKLKLLTSGAFYSGAVIENNKGNDHLYVWGHNNNAQLGSGTTNDKQKPIKVDPDGGIISDLPFIDTNYIDGEVIALEFGYDHSGIVIADEGEEILHMWGNGTQGQVGNGRAKLVKKSKKILKSEFIELPEIVSASVDNITKESIDVSWEVQENGFAVDAIKLLDGEDNLIKEFAKSLEGTETVDGLEVDTEYDFKLIIEYQNFGEVTSQEYALDSFRTMPEDETPVVDSAYFDNIIDTQATFEWNISVVTDTITSIKLMMGSEEHLLDKTLSGSTIIDGLSPNTYYEGNSLVIDYIDATSNPQTVEYDVASFTTTATIEEPVLNSATFENITATSADFNWDLDATTNTINSIKLNHGSETKDLGTSVNGTVTIDGLESNTLYEGLTLTVDYEDAASNLQVKTFDVASFATDILVEEPVLNSATFENITATSADFNWDLDVKSNSINSIELNHGTDTKSLGTDASGNVVIDGLTAETLYDGLTLVVNYVDAASNPQEITFAVASFSTLAVGQPIVNATTVSNITSTSIDFSWDISDPEGNVIEIKLIGTGVSLSLGTQLSGSVTVNALSEDTEYNDWQLQIEYSNPDGTSKVVEHDIASFATIPSSEIVNPTDPEKDSYIIILTILIISIITILLLAIASIVDAIINKNN